MKTWQHTIKVKHLFTKNEDHKSIQDSMNKVAEVLENSNLFPVTNLEDFRNIPQGDNYFGPVDYANKLLSNMYDWADFNDIWIE